MKRLLMILLLVCFMGSFTACGNEKDDDERPRVSNESDEEEDEDSSVKDTEEKEEKEKTEENTDVGNTD